MIKKLIKKYRLWKHERRKKRAIKRLNESIDKTGNHNPILERLKRSGIKQEDTQTLSKTITKKLKVDWK